MFLKHKVNSGLRTLEDSEVFKQRSPAELRKKASDRAAKGLRPTARPSHSWGRRWRAGHQALPTRCPSRRRARARRACRAGSAPSWRPRESPELRWRQCACRPRIAAPAGVPEIRALLVCHCHLPGQPQAICAAAIVTRCTSQSAHRERCQSVRTRQCTAQVWLGERIYAALCRPAHRG